VGIVEGLPVPVVVEIVGVGYLKVGVVIGITVAVVFILGICLTVVAVNVVGI